MLIDFLRIIALFSKDIFLDCKETFSCMQNNVINTPLITLSCMQRYVVWLTPRQLLPLNTLIMYFPGASILLQCVCANSFHITVPFLP